MKPQNTNLEKKVAELNVLTKTSSIINSTLNLQKLLKVVLQLVTKVLQVEASSLILLDKEKNELVFEVALGKKCKEVKRIIFPADKGIAGWVIQNNKPLMVNDVTKDTRFYARIDLLTNYKTKSIICVPLKLKKKIIGVIEVINKIDGDFEQEDVRLLSAIANQVVIAIENAQLYKKLEKKVELANKELIQEKDKIKAIIEGMGDSLFVTDKNLKVILLNHHAKKLLGECIDYSLKDIIADEKFIQVYQNAARESKEVETEIEFNLHTYSIVITPLKQKKEIIGQVTVMRDITGQKEMERMKSNFLSLVSHELKTPLTSIKTFSEMLLEEDLDTKTQQEFLQLIDEETNRLTRLLEDLLVASKLDLGKRKINKQLLNTKEVLEGIILRFKKLAEKNGVVIDIKISDTSQQILADKDAFDQIMINLISNAIKYSPKGGKVKIEVKKIGYEELPEVMKKNLFPDEYTLISVADTGIGISKYEMKHLFVDEFFRSERKEVREISGTGLGLTIVRRLVTQQGGVVFAESKVGLGSKFSFVLPYQFRV